MRSSLLQLARSFWAALLILVFLVPNSAIAQGAQHVVSPSDLKNAAVNASEARQKNLDTLNNFFSSREAKKALESAKIDPQQVKKAVAGLSNEELAQLATRAQNAQNDFAAGYIGDRDLLIILVCIAALILIIVAVR
jgi:hypothetical protein